MLVPVNLYIWSSLKMHIILLKEANVIVIFILKNTALKEKQCFIIYSLFITHLNEMLCQYSGHAYSQYLHKMWEFMSFPP